MIGGTLTIVLHTKKRNNCISGKEYCHIRQKKSPLMNGTLKLEFSIILAIIEKLTTLYKIVRWYIIDIKKNWRVRHSQRGS